MRRVDLAIIMATILTACSATKDNSQLAKFDATLIQAASDKYCKPGQQLTENTNAIQADFEDLGSGAPIFGFVNGSDNCALTNDIDDHWSQPLSDDGWFHVAIHSSCLKNGSLWEIQSSLNASPGHYYTLKSFDDTSAATIDLNAIRDLPGAYARDHAGLRILTCQ